jgi:hypothetical protein
VVIPLFLSLSAILVALVVKVVIPALVAVVGLTAIAAVANGDKGVALKATLSTKGAAVVGVMVAAVIEVDPLAAFTTVAVAVVVVVIAFSSIGLIPVMLEGAVCETISPWDTSKQPSLLAEEKAAEVIEVDEVEFCSELPLAVGVRAVSGEKSIMSLSSADKE